MLAARVALAERFLGPSVASGELLDPVAAREAKAQRWQRLHRFHIPILRLLGFGLLSSGVFLYNRYFAKLGARGDELALSFTLVALGYAFLAWPLMTWVWPRFRKLDLVLLLTDIPLLVGAVYATGGEESWMVSLLLLRIADQSPYGTRRALSFSAIVIVGFLALVLWLDYGEGRAIDWQRELTKGALLSAAGLYVGLTARGSDLQRKRISRTMALTRDLIRHLEEARDEARSASIAKGQFLANMSHEIRTPLNAVVGLSDLLLRDNLPPEQHRRVQLLQSSATALLGVLGDVLDFSKIEADRLVLEQAPVQLETVAHECRHLFEPLAVEQGLELVVLADASLPWVLGDQARLRQIFVNLLGNALKFTDEGKIELRLALVSEDPLRIRVEVEDTGLGIPAEALDSLFDPFTQVDASSSRRRPGTGLGLAICQSLVQAMGGTIGVQSEVGQGTLFWLEIPFQPTDPPAEAPRAQTELPAITGHLLLVEDNEVNRHVAVAMIEKLGATVEVAENGRRALELFSPDQFDLVLMDCQMPELDGYEATRSIRRLEAPTGGRIPIIALTADAQEENRRRCLEAGMDDYLSKPLRMDSLHARLAHWLGG